MRPREVLHHHWESTGQTHWGWSLWWKYARGLPTAGLRSIFCIHVVLLEQSLWANSAAVQEVYPSWHPHLVRNSDPWKDSGSVMEVTVVPDARPAMGWATLWVALQPQAICVDYRFWIHKVLTSNMIVLLNLKVSWLTKTEIRAWKLHGASPEYVLQWFA